VHGRDRGRCARRRCEDHRLPLGGGAARCDGEERYRDEAELKGKAIAVRRRDRFQTCSRAWRSKFAIALSEVKLAAVGGDRDRYNALVGGVDRCRVGVQRISATGRRRKSLKMLLEGKDGPDFCGSAMFSTGKVLRERRDAAIPLSHGAVEGAALCAVAQDRPSSSRSKPANGADDLTPGLRVRRCRQTGAITPVGRSMDKIAWMADQLVALGQIPNAGDLDKMVDTASGPSPQACRRSRTIRSIRNDSEETRWARTIRA